MTDYNPQPILKKKWGIKAKVGEIKTKRIIIERRFFKHNHIRYFSFFVYECIGRKVWRYLGESDNLGRPI